LGPTSFGSTDGFGIILSSLDAADEVGVKVITPSLDAADEVGVNIIPSLSELPDGVLSPSSFEPTAGFFDPTDQYIVDSPELEVDEGCI
jgi:hypothetical protein